MIAPTNTTFNVNWAQYAAPSIQFIRQLVSGAEAGVVQRGRGPPRLTLTALSERHVLHLDYEVEPRSAEPFPSAYKTAAETPLSLRPRRPCRLSRPESLAGVS